MFSDNKQYNINTCIVNKFILQKMELLYFMALKSNVYKRLINKNYSKW